MPPGLRHEPRKHLAPMRPDRWCDGPGLVPVEGSGVPFDGFAREPAAEPDPARAAQIALPTTQPFG